MRRLLAGALVALLSLSVGCSSADRPSATVVEDSAVRLARLRDAVADVASAQSAADDMLSRLVTSLRDLDTTVAGMRAEDTIDDAIDSWAQVALDWPDEAAPPVRAAMVDVATAVDDARMLLISVRSQRTDPWDRMYLDAEDEVLTALRAYAAAADRLAQAIEQHWEHLVVVHDLVSSFVERRWFFRTSAEATQAFEVEVDDLVGGLEAAARDINAITQEREQAATAVNQATASARDLWVQRPEPTPSP